MDPEDVALELKCENLMNIVVETRKKFRKDCIKYEQKKSIVENEILNLQVESNNRLKPKNLIQYPCINEHDASKNLDDLALKITEKQRRIEDIKIWIKNTREVIMQLEADEIGKKLRAPLTVEAMMAEAKAKNV